MHRLPSRCAALCGFAFASPVVFSAQDSIAPSTADAEAAELARWAADRDERMAWWRDARLGMFIHWGLYSGAGGAWDGKVYPQHYAEWIQNWAAVPCDEYAEKMKPLFAPDENFAEAWAALAAEAGMRYAVLTAKHHEGFTLFDSDEAYSIDNPVTGGTNISPDGRDVAREFADAMRARGLRPGFYYSLLDWQHPDAYEMALPGYPRDAERSRDHDAYRAYVRRHVDELLTGYGPLGTLWFDYSDAARQGAAWGAADLMEAMRTTQPGILVNNRLYQGLENRNGDYGTPEKYVPPTGLPGMDWEVNHTLNESYGYSGHDENWKSTTDVVRLLCDIVSKGGNLLLNVGPDARGRIPQPSIDALRGLGRWMRVNDEAVYGTTASPFPRLPWGRATRKGDMLYLMVFDWPDDGRLFVPMRGEVRSARILGGSNRLEFGPNRARGGELEIRVPSAPVDEACTVVALDLGGPVDPTPFRVHPAADGSIELLPHDARLEGPSIRVEQVGVVGDVAFNIGYWLDEAATATWPFGVGPRGGTFDVEIDLACRNEAAGAEMNLVIDSGDDSLRELSFTMPGTGDGWHAYETLRIGAVDLEPGPVHRLTLRAVSKPGEAVGNVRAVRLVPVR
jgi:alpha-L-fucosidase